MKRALLVSTTLLGVVLSLAGGRADGWYHATYREGIALAREGAFRAGVSIGDLNAWASSTSGTGGRRAYVCPFVEDTSRRVAAVGDCVDASPVIDPTLASASITATIPAPMVRTTDGASAGATMLTVSIRWTDMSPPLPRSSGSLEHCGWSGYAPDSFVVRAEPVTEAVSSGIAEGTITSPELGTVHFRRSTMTSDAVLIEGVASGFQGSLRAERPAGSEVGCKRTFYSSLPAAKRS